MNRINAQGVTLAIIGVPGCWLFHRACGGLLENMARRSTGRESGTDTRQKERERKKNHNDEQGEADRLMAFSMFYRIKGMEATGQVHDIWPRERLFIIRHVVFRYWAWIFWRPGLGI